MRWQLKQMTAGLVMLGAWVLILGSGALAEKPPEEVIVYNWEDYLGPTTIRDFEKETGIKVRLETFEDEDLMLSSLQSCAGCYDVVVASGDSISALTQMRLLAEIDLNNIPNLKNVARAYRNMPFDPQQKYSIPYLWGTTGIVVNRKHVRGENISWKILFDPQYKGKVAMLNNIDEVFGAALKSMGYSINETDENKSDEAGQMLVRQKDMIVGYLDPIAIRDKLISGEIWIAMEYSGEAMFAADKNKDLEFVIPVEGANLWIDNFVIARDAPNQAAGERFINFVLDAKNSARISNYLWYASSNVAARPYTLKEILENKKIYPSPEVLKKCEAYSLSSSPDGLQTYQKVRNKYWAQLHY